MSSSSTPATASSTAAFPTGSKRLFSIDFWRGLSLVIIFVDHFPGNPVRRFTITGISFADAAALFFFMSGFVSYLAFSSLLRRSGWGAVLRRLGRRICLLYLAHLVSVAGALLLLIFYYRGPLDLPAPMWGMAETEAAIIAFPWQELGRSMLLDSQLSLANIFPLYILFLAVTPLALLLLRKSRWLLLLVSGGTWALMNALDVLLGTTPSLPVSDRWLHPLAWQFVFFAGFTLGEAYRSKAYSWGQLRRPFVFAGLLIAVLVAGSEIQNQAAYYSGAAAGPMEPVFASKRMAAPTYLLSFALLFLLVRHFLRTNADVARLPASEPIRRLGRNSLLVWTLSIIGCHAVLILSRAVTDPGTARHVLQLAVSFLYFGLLSIMLARLPASVVRRSDFSRRPIAGTDIRPESTS